MPLIKFCTKQNIAYAAKSYHEYVGPVVVFSVDLFNVYYVAICMQASKSIITTLIIMGTGTFHVVLALRAIFWGKRSEKPHHQQNEPAIKYYLQDLPALLQKLAHGESLPAHYKRHIRLFAPFPLPILKSSAAFMDEMSKSRRFTSDKATNRRCSSKAAIKRKSGVASRVYDSSQLGPIQFFSKQHQITPTGPVTQGDIPVIASLLSRSSESSKPGDDELSSDDQEVARVALQTLFHSEYILLAEYIEFMVPIWYAVYLTVLFQLPVAAYYPYTASITEQKLKMAVRNILIYGVIEFLSFGALLVILGRKFGFSPLYQLAFVLETHAHALQGHLFVWTITILHLTVKHYGKH
ncbi:unnamed protein product [Phytophthora fragariaefolia]|uniref:Unnamed protein product n=1 Tax=Phytophthora fragariaefolia TaxID=1490495 RepID=A0A9W6TYB2_9STRA|nr:unnamed protein product [Phytophthora fragariaefolia]